MQERIWSFSSGLLTLGRLQYAPCATLKELERCVSYRPSHAVEAPFDERDWVGLVRRVNTPVEAQENCCTLLYPIVRVRIELVK
jgi:hypothetical protein